MASITTDETRKLATRRANFLKRVRQLHLWLGTLFAPAIIFFALTGVLQVFSLHEGRPGGQYQPPAWIVKLAQIHKKQDLAVRPPGRKKVPAADREATPARPAQEPARPQSNMLFVYLLKWFVALMGLGLTFTTALGIIMAFQFARDKRVIWLLLVLGTLIPAALIFAL
jgi:hypothetical protein